MNKGKYEGPSEFEEIYRKKDRLTQTTMLAKEWGDITRLPWSYGQMQAAFLAGNLNRHLVEQIVFEAKKKKGK